MEPSINISPQEMWKKCPKNSDVLKIEEKVVQFLKQHNIPISLEKIEEWIYLCPPGREGEIFDSLLEKVKGGNLHDLLEFNELFRSQLFSVVPQRILNGLSPVRYALNLKRLRE